MIIVNKIMQMLFRLLQRKHCLKSLSEKKEKDNKSSCSSFPPAMTMSYGHNLYRLILSYKENYFLVDILSRRMLIEWKNQVYFRHILLDCRNLNFRIIRKEHSDIIRIR